MPCDFFDPESLNWVGCLISDQDNRCGGVQSELPHSKASAHTQSKAKSVLQQFLALQHPFIN